MNGKFFVCGCLVTAFLLVLCPTSRAEDANTADQNPQPQVQTRPERPGNPNRGQGPLAFPGTAATGPISVLTPQQRATFQTALRTQRGKMLELDSKLRAARHELDVASVTSQFDENVIREKALAAARIEVEMTVVRVKCLSLVQPPLSPEQIERIKTTTPATPLSLERQQQRPVPPASATTNRDENGLPPKR